jgi:hypothetical protein
VVGAERTDSEPDPLREDGGAAIGAAPWVAKLGKSLRVAKFGKSGAVVGGICLTTVDA